MPVPSDLPRALDHLAARPALVRPAGELRVGAIAPDQLRLSRDHDEAAASHLEGLIDASTGVPARKRSWAQLSTPEQAALATLGYGGGAWDAVRNGRLSQLPEAAQKPYPQLSADQQRAVRQLGYGPSDWEAERQTRVDILANPKIRDSFEHLLSKDGVISEQDVRDRLLPAARDWGVESPARKRALLYLLDAHGSAFTESARRAIRDDVVAQNLIEQVQGGFSDEGWNASITPAMKAAVLREVAAGREPQIVNDASGLDPTLVREVRHVTSVAEVQQAVTDARRLGLKISIAGRRHSEGGQSSAVDSLNLDMMGLHDTQLLADGQTLRVGTGATWAQVQAYLGQHGRAVKVMQTSNIFTVGGAFSVDAHGRTPGEAPFVSTVKGFDIVTADGQLRHVTRESDPDLFKHAIGGYGLFGVVTSVDLDTRENVDAVLHVDEIAAKDFPARFQAAAAQPGVELAFGRLSPTLDGTALLHVVRRTSSVPATAAGGADLGVEGQGATAGVAKAMLELSRHGPEFLEARWWAEQMMKGKDATGTLNGFMAPNVDSLRQYWFNEGKKTDILHEYYIPHARFQEFVDGMKAVQHKHGMDTLNITIRDVATDHETALPYAKKDSYAFVLYYNQELDAKGNAKQAALTRDLIDLSERLGGTFYLPYQPVYTPEQLRRAYPEWDAFVAKKRELDPTGLFTNAFYEKYGEGAPAAGGAADATP